MMALPSAKSYAIKDAADHLGSLFGRDLNRKDAPAFSPTYSDPVTIESELKELLNLKKDSLSEDEIIGIERVIQTKEVNSYRKSLNVLKSK